ESLREAIEPELPPGMKLAAIEMLPAPDRKAQVRFVTFEIPIPPPRQAELAERIEWFFGQAAVPIERPGRARPVDLRPLVGGLSLGAGTLSMRLRVDREGSARPREVLEVLGVANLEYEGFFLTRTCVEIA